MKLVYQQGREKKKKKDDNQYPGLVCVSNNQGDAKAIFCIINPIFMMESFSIWTVLFSYSVDELLIVFAFHELCLYVRVQVT